MVNQTWRNSQLRSHLDLCPRQATVKRRHASVQKFKMGEVRSLLIVCVGGTILELHPNFIFIVALAAGHVTKAEFLVPRHKRVVSCLERDPPALRLRHAISLGDGPLHHPGTQTGPSVRLGHKNEADVELRLVLLHVVAEESTEAFLSVLAHRTE